MKVFHSVVFGVVVLFLAVLFASPVLAADKDFKVGVVNVQKVMRLSKLGQEAKNAVSAKFDEYQSMLQKEEESLMLMKDEIEKKGSVWSEEVKASKEREFERRVKALEDQSKYATDDMRDFEKKMVEPILEKLEGILEDFSKRGGYSLLMDSSRGVLFVDESYDISAALAAELDKAEERKKE